ncbi:S28 family serine protease [Streptomyces sp. NBC_00091]|uniref:S28 family serine protease n=1 Tax=Streptomyces sp. NBC_00091 TaxID=2975648 RepID=UPI00224D9231|nr:S28 family serine protease [Streptomyces sp. NBC_00091]MCX5377885.1 S28 family serine protease [Streptomyces sp. NBC_00091]
MRRTLRWLLTLVVLIGTAGAAGATPGATTAAAERPPTADIKDRLLAIPGMSLIEEKPAPGYRFFVLSYTQPVDHRDPSKGTFQQRLSVLHKDTSSPTVFYTRGYGLMPEGEEPAPERQEPTQIVDGNQVTVEYRFFTPSSPDPVDWTKAGIWQGASDHHRIHQALKKIYGKKWISTGNSKSGMVATYYERFYPHDMDGVVAYSASNDAVNDDDSAYDRFFATVGTQECRDRLNAIEREALIRREPLERLLQQWADTNGYSYDVLGGLDRGFEAVVRDFAWVFWQYDHEANCLSEIPVAATASDQELFDIIDLVSGWLYYTDQDHLFYIPYYYQAGTELGWPTIQSPHLAGLNRYSYPTMREQVPRDIPMTFKPGVMRDMDGWIRRHADHMLFIYGQNDPWAAEKFRPGKGSRDSYVLTGPGANHDILVPDLTESDRTLATAKILEWAGVADAAVLADPAQAKPLAKYDAALDKADSEREPRRRR